MTLRWLQQPLTQVLLAGALMTLVPAAAVGKAPGQTDHPAHPDKSRHAPPVMTMELPVTTQGLMWPPAEVVDKDGHFVLVGSALKRNTQGEVVPIPGQALLVNRETVPPLDEQGVEAPGLGGAPYSIIRPLDLSEGSPDLDIELYANSYGPALGRGGRPNIPKAGDAQYNLNGAGVVCPEVFPAESQARSYTRESVPLHQVPVYGFKGDDRVYDVDTGEARPQSEPGLDERRKAPVTLKDWMDSSARLRITLQAPNSEGEYTGAEFDFRLMNMLPNALYTVWAVRAGGPDALATPNMITTDARGTGRARFEVTHPFPDPQGEESAQRIRGLAIVYHSDNQNWGGCFSRFGPGVDAHAVFNSFKQTPGGPDSRAELTDFITVAP